ncbi:hypothetical protein EGT74_27105 [Chitinophaga lutea]|uniref:Uncharacterized protein n=1 Tax=Chitinophaga lutea TaxID=2488634 RepID=A0A3N4PQM2_9BACT|nr:hypothetical protein EGT74_27105 [Chitinophaga lutea]
MQSRATELEIGRADVHVNGEWWGSMIARFRFHMTGWGNGSNFVNAEIYSYSYGPSNQFVAGWHDATVAGGIGIIIWLRGATTYTYYANGPVAPLVYDNVANPLPYTEPAGTVHNYLTEILPYVNREGISNQGTAYFRSGGPNFFQGSVGVGTKPAAKFHIAGGGYTNDIAAMNQNSAARIDVANPAITLGIGYNLQDQPVIQSYNNVIGNPVNLQLNPYGGNVAIGTTQSHGHRLAVGGSILAERVKVKLQSAWPDYVFQPGYALRSLEELERFVMTHRHLPDIPSEAEMKKTGLDVEEMNAKLLKKVEEQALYIIELNKKLAALEQRVNKLDAK